MCPSRRLLYRTMMILLQATPRLYLSAPWILVTEQLAVRFAAKWQRHYTEKWRRRSLRTNRGCQHMHTKEPFNSKSLLYTLSLPVDTWPPFNQHSPTPWYLCRTRGSHRHARAIPATSIEGAPRHHRKNHNPPAVVRRVVCLEAPTWMPWR